MDDLQNALTKAVEAAVVAALAAKVSEPDWQFIGRLIREMQAEMRTIRSENALTRRMVAENATRDDLRAIVDTIVNRIAQFEAMIEERLDRLERK